VRKIAASRVIRRGELTKTAAQCQVGFEALGPRESGRSVSAGLSKLQRAQFGAAPGTTWHVNCEHIREIERMAAKIKIMKLLQEIRGFADISNRLPQPRPLGLFLLQLRSHLVQTTAVRRKRTIVIQMQGQTEIPYPVKITHMPPDPLLSKKNQGQSLAIQTT
jgi:hypothetical protein